MCFALIIVLCAINCPVTGINVNDIIRRTFNAIRCKDNGIDRIGVNVVTGYRCDITLRILIKNHHFTEEEGSSKRVVQFISFVNSGSFSCRRA